MTQYIEMIVLYNEYNKTEYRRKFYVQPRRILEGGNYEPCYTEYNRYYSDEYDFYHAIEENGGFSYIAVPKPSYRIYFDDDSIGDYDYNELVETINGECDVADLRLGDNIYCRDNQIRIVIKVETY